MKNTIRWRQTFSNPTGTFQSRRFRLRYSLTENEYTAKFDDVMLLENAHCNYLDKLSMLESLPYDVNISLMQIVLHTGI